MKFPHFIRSQDRTTTIPACATITCSGISGRAVPNPHIRLLACLMGERGLPRTWRNMNGYGSHTYT